MEPGDSERAENLVTKGRGTQNGVYGTAGVMRFAVAFPLVCFGAINAQAQISPGPLAKAHSSLEGATHCTDCHAISFGSSQYKCLDCHKEIRERIAEHRGLHSSYLPKGATGKDCVTCHSDHNGVDFNLIHWEPSIQAFDHSKTSYPLTGGHAGLKCEQCHNAQNIPANERSSIVVKDLNRTFLGLSQDCNTCHADEHHGQLGLNCASCHTEASWKPATKFNHATTKYPLTGAHVNVACAKCHATVAGPKPYVKYAGIAFEKCSDCHADPHHGAFKNSCESCHNTISWKQVKLTEGFDHSKTAFPLLGGHKTVPCEGCHKTGDFKAAIPFKKCVDCHLPDPHRGQFAKSRFGADCSFCHTVETFKSTTCGVKEHAETSYPLQGKHASVTCAQCHIPKGVDTLFAIHDVSCAACHADIHKGQFAGPPHKNRCEDCHTVEGFRPARFTLAQHNSTRFPLTGAHVAVACVDCHKAEKAQAPETVKYRFEDRSCTACHTDPHKGQFAKMMAARFADGSLERCAACHTTNSWLEISNFDHTKTTFPLEGAHRSLACSQCHRPENPKAGVESINFKTAPTKCASCHDDVHGGQFAKSKAGMACSVCHSAVQWKPAPFFNHDTQTAFALKGAHERVACDQCHKLFREIGGKRILFYKPTPKDCAACHGPEVKGTE
ncbi:MAG TPA: hypothetical protein VGT03_04745 [Candidatus Acidoferrales bacterium]|nr:hypothetical protein [Candidatus Acidoferrales bacterium]